MTAWTELTTEVVDRGVYDRAVRHLRKARVVLPTFAELADPRKIPAAVTSELAQINADAAHAGNLFRVHWYNDTARRGVASHPPYLDLPEALTGVKARILVALARYFPMIGAHKVLAAYGCLVPRLVTGQFDPTRHRAIWPSTGNYARGGIGISRIYLGYHYLTDVVGGFLAGIAWLLIIGAAFRIRPTGWSWRLPARRLLR